MLLAQLTNPNILNSGSLAKHHPSSKSHSAPPRRAHPKKSISVTYHPVPRSSLSRLSVGAFKDQGHGREAGGPPIINIQSPSNEILEANESSQQTSSISEPTVTGKSVEEETKINENENKEYIHVFEDLKSQSPQNEFENMFNVDL